jgi:hypothetical protein
VPEAGGVYDVVRPGPADAPLSRLALAFLPRARMQRLFERHRTKLSAEQRKRGFAAFWANVELLVGRLKDAASRISDALEPVVAPAAARRRIA